MANNDTGAYRSLLLNQEYTLTEHTLDPSYDTEYTGGHHHHHQHGPKIGAKTHRLHLLGSLLRRTATWVISGVCIMAAGITSVYFFILPRIYECPHGAICPRSMDLGRLPLIQTLMHYWLQAGAIIAGVGLAKLMAYQSCFVMRSQGDSIKILDHNFGAIKGSAMDAGFLLWRRRNRSLGLFTLSLILVTTSIPLIVGLSFNNAMTWQEAAEIRFVYPQRISIGPDQWWVTAVSKLDLWAFAGDTQHGVTPGFQGTFVVPDNRTALGVKPQPSGLKIQGSLQCTGEGLTITRIVNTAPPAYTVIPQPTSTGQAAPTPTSDNGYDISLGTTHIGRAYSSQRLAARCLRNLTSISSRDDTQASKDTRYLWVSNADGLIPNATQSADGSLHVALCTHAVSLYNTTAGKEVKKYRSRYDTQYISPSSFAVIDSSNDSCTDGDCALTKVLDLVEMWWNPTSDSFESLNTVSCQSGLLSPFSRNVNQSCQLTNDTWTATAAAALDALVQSGNATGNSEELLWAHPHAIRMDLWWVHCIIPLCILLLYGLLLGYLLYLNRGYEMSQLSLYEIFVTLHTPEVCALLQHGELTEETKLGPVDDHEMPIR